MPQKITETRTRWCCEPQDLVADALHPEGVHGDLHYARPGHYHNPWRYKVCKHCGQRFEYYRFMDAAGSMDWDYRPVA